MLEQIARDRFDPGVAARGSLLHRAGELIQEKGNLGRRRSPAMIGQRACKAGHTLDDIEAALAFGAAALRKIVNLTHIATARTEKIGIERYDDFRSLAQQAR